MGRTPGCAGCAGCEAVLIIWGRCPPSFEVVLGHDRGHHRGFEDGQVISSRLRDRLEQYQRIVSNRVAPESFHYVPVPFAAVHWPDGVEVGNDVSENDADDGFQLVGFAAVEASISAVYSGHTQRKPDEKVATEGIRHFLRRFDKEMVAKVELRMHIASLKKNSNPHGLVMFVNRPLVLRLLLCLAASFPLDRSIAASGPQDVNQHRAHGA